MQVHSKRTMSNNCRSWDQRNFLKATLHYSQLDSLEVVHVRKSLAISLLSNVNVLFTMLGKTGLASREKLKNGASR